MTYTKDTPQEIITKFADEKQELSDDLLSTLTKVFSDITPKPLAFALEIWNEIKLSRRHNLLAHLKKELEENLLLCYDSLASHLLKDDDAIIRSFALRLLKDYEDEDLLPVFIDIALKDSETEPRKEAIKLLGIYVYYGELEEVSSENLKKIEETLIRIMQDDEEKSIIRQQTIEALGFSSRKEVPTFIEDAWQKNTPLWKASAVFAMGRSYNPIWSPRILEALKDDNDIIRFAAIKSAEGLALQEARPILLDALKEESDADLIDAIVWALSEIGGEDVRTHLLALLDQYEEDEEEEAVEYIESALENLDFTEDVQNLDLANFDLDL